ncbi:MAG: DUF4270 domain-containing protein [Bacteroidota bacterium]
MKKKIAVLFLVFSMVFISCDQDFNTIGADLVGDEHFDFDKYEVNGLKAFSVKTEEVQTNNLPINPLGFYNNPYFGQTKANFVTQLALSTEQPKFGTSVQVDNITLYVPYYSSVESTNADGSQVYSLDSIYGVNKESKMKLSVYENGYFINTFDPNNNFQTAQRYYSDMDNTIDAQKKGHDGSGNSGTLVLNDSPNSAENEQFFFSKSEIVIYNRKYNAVSGEFEYVDSNDAFIVPQSNVTPRVVKERLAPGIYLTLNKEFFKKKILNATSSELFNNNNFRQYFKGLYFKMEQVAGQEGAMAMLNFTNAKVNFNYSSINQGATNPVVTYKTFVMNLGLNALGNCISLQDFNYGGNYNTGLSDPANTFGSPTFGQNERLYVKGGKGSLVYIDVFGDTDVKGIVNGVFVPGANQIPDELEELKLKGWLINDAYLEFFIDQSATTGMGGANQIESERIYLFDATNQKSLVDYNFDSTTSSNSKYNKLIYGGIIQRDDTPANKGVKYKIRITQHINNLINSTNVNLNKNVRLGLSVTENIGLSGNYYFKNPLTFGTVSTSDDIEKFPAASIMSQQGTVLHGTHSSDASKKLKLVIHFTKPN